jgi:hypothetical protein
MRMNESLHSLSVADIAARCPYPEKWESVERPAFQTILEACCAQSTELWSARTGPRFSEATRRRQSRVTVVLQSRPLRAVLHWRPSHRTPTEHHSSQIHWLFKSEIRPSVEIRSFLACLHSMSSCAFKRTLLKLASCDKNSPSAVQWESGLIQSQNLHENEDAFLMADVVTCRRNAVWHTPWCSRRCSYKRYSHQCQ